MQVGSQSKKKEVQTMLSNMTSVPLDDYQTDKIIRSFDREMSSLSHNYCSSCRRVSLNLSIDDNSGFCTDCLDSTYREGIKRHLPVWQDENDNTHYELPQELVGLREAEKLLISQYATYIPLEHLRKGQFGCSGHVCCFPQDIQGICKTLPRLPSDVQTIRIVKHFKQKDEDYRTKTFTVRRAKVLGALRWLKQYNPYYKEIEIAESNLEWMSGRDEAELPNTQSTYTELNEEELDQSDDKGPSPQQVVPFQGRFVVCVFNIFIHIFFQKKSVIYPFQTQHITYAVWCMHLWEKT